jgi:tRNA(Phe) wybutosine-synthesizing methylase Tyw3
MIKSFALDTLTVSQKRLLIVELRNSIKLDRDIARSAKVLARADKAQAREDKKAERIAKLQAKLDALLNPVGAKAIKASKKPSKAVVTKLA